MKKDTLRTFEATALLVGNIVGAGVLGIPYVVARAGFGIGMVYIIGIGLLFLLLNLLVGETVARTKHQFQIVGLAEKYLGRWGKRITVVTIFFSIYGALLAYIIGEGEILSALFGGRNIVWSLVFFCVVAVISYTGITIIKRFELLLTLILSSIVFLIAFLNFPSIHTEYLYGTSWENIFFPFGVMLFAYGGISAIPQMEEILSDNPKKFKQAIVWGSCIPIILYVLFAFSVVGVTGPFTTEVATVGLGRSLGSSMIVFGNLFAFFSMSTSFIALSFALKRSLQWDYHLGHPVAWLATILVPLFLFLGGMQSFIHTIDTVGAWFGTLTTIIIVLIFWKAKRQGDVHSRIFNIPHGFLVGIILILFFVVGMLLRM